MPAGVPVFMPSKISMHATDSSETEEKSAGPLGMLEGGASKKPRTESSLSGANAPKTVMGPKLVLLCISSFGDDGTRTTS
jgi:hypothetical protein